MTVKANIHVYGNIQGVGYRVLVKNVARLMNVRGLVRDLEDGLSRSSLKQKML
jgi:acylphosphatase